MVELNIKDFVNYIYNDKPEDDKKIIYLSIGSAAHMARVINGERIIEVEVDQQYPLFMRNLHKKHPEYSIYIVLIDPVLEKPCFTVSRKVKDGIESPLDDLWEKDERYNNIYHYLIGQIHILEFRNFVKYGKDVGIWHPEGTIDINHQIDSLVNISLLNKWFLICMEYTGRDLIGLAESYDPIVGKDKDHVFFGLPSRIEGGCYVNLSEETTNYITNLKKGYMTAFTPYNYNDAEILEIYNKNKNLDNEDSKIISGQIKLSFLRVISTYKTHVLSILRRLIHHYKKLSNGDTGLDFYHGEFVYLSNKYKIDDFHVKINTQLNSIIETVSKISDAEFQYILNFFGKQEIFPKYLEEKANDDPYKMYSGITKILTELCPE